MINYFPEKKTFSLSEGTLLKKLKLFWQNVLLFYFNIHEKFISYPIQDFYPNNALMLFHKGNFYCKAPTNPHALFYFAEKSFSVFNGAPSDTLNVFFGKIIYYFFFQHPWKVCFVSIQKFNFYNTLMLSKNIIYFCKVL